MTHDRYVVSAMKAELGPSEEITELANRHGGIQLIWTDPPYGTGKRQSRANRNHVGYSDPSDIGYVLDGISAWIPFVAPNGTVVVCCDYRACWKICARMDSEGWDLRGEVIWTFNLGMPRKSWWAVRHNTMLTFSRPGESPKFKHDSIPQVERSSGPMTKVANGKVYEYGPTRPIGSVWDMTFSGSDGERVDHPNQKPIRIISPFISAHTDEGDLIADPFMGSGSTGVAALRLGRNFAGNDMRQFSVDTAVSRLEKELNRET